jgi:hypothetical protein
MFNAQFSIFKWEDRIERLLWPELPAPAFKDVENIEHSTLNMEHRRERGNQKSQKPEHDPSTGSVTVVGRDCVPARRHAVSAYRDAVKRIFDSTGTSPVGTLE